MYKQKIIFFFLILALLFALAGVIIFLTIKFPLYIQNASYWVKEGFIVKEHRAEMITEPKIIIASGSNSLFSICTPLLEEKTNQKVVNFGNNSYLPIEIYFGLIKKHAKPYDTVIMPLEYEFYTRNKSIQDWLIRGLATWGIEFIQEFSIDQIFQICLKTLPYLPARIKNYNVKFPIRTYEEYIKGITPSAILTKSWQHDNLYNAFGDTIVDNASILENKTKHYFSATKLLDYRFQQLKDFSDFLAKQNIKLVLTYPVTIQNSDFDLTQQKYMNQIEAVNKKFQKFNLTYIGIPELSNFEFELSYNSFYHLNAEGAMLRTLYLADTINCYFAHKTQKIENLAEYKKQKKAEAKKILEEYRKLGYYAK